jgi:hypothetical protein
MASAPATSWRGPVTSATPAHAAPVAAARRTVRPARARNSGLAAR